MLYNIFNALDMVEKEERTKIVEAGFEGKHAPIPVEPLAKFVEDGLKDFLLKLEYWGAPRKVKVEFVKDYDGEINFETDECRYLTVNGKLYYAWVNGTLEMTNEEISLVCEVFWSE